jgi:hypothetical protein
VTTYDIELVTVVFWRAEEGKPFGAPLARAQVRADRVLPRIGERVDLEFYTGRVVDIRHVLRRQDTTVDVAITLD